MKLINKLERILAQTYGAVEAKRIAGQVRQKTASFCKTDEVMAELFPPSIRFVRLHTLGRGDSMCDFQYCRIASPAHRRSS